MVSILAEEDIVKIGIWLSKEGYFTGNMSLRILWLFQVFLTLGIQAYFAVEIYIVYNKDKFESAIWADAEDIDYEVVFD